MWRNCGSWYAPRIKDPGKQSQKSEALSNGISQYTVEERTVKSFFLKDAKN